MSLLPFKPIEHLTTFDYKQIEKAFTQELIQASLGKPSSLSFIKHHLPKQPLIITGIAQGIVIGGTNYIISTEELHANGTNNILDRQTGKLPVLKDEQTFFAFMEKHLDERATAIGVNFAFPLTPTLGFHGELDGILISGEKEHALRGLLGQTIGKEINKLFQKKFSRDIPVAVANDTICLILSGDNTENGSIITGTGFNM